MNEFASTVERHRHELLVHCYRMLGSAAEVQINGGDLYQANGRAVAISGIVQLRFVDGTTSQGTVIPAQPNKARFENNGAEISSQFVVSPNP